MPWLFIMFVLVPALELYLLIEIGQMIGAMPTFGIILATGLLGSWMAKTQGLHVWRSLNRKLSSGQIPGKELVDGAIILISGALLLTPGVLTDVVGLLGLFPLTRVAFRTLLSKYLKTGPSLAFGESAHSGFGQPSEPQEPVYTETGTILSGHAKARPTHEE